MFPDRSGLPAAGRVYHDRFAIHFKKIAKSGPFKKTCKLLRTKINSFSKSKELDNATEELAKVVPGSLGHYHYKMLKDFLVAANMVPPRWVVSYPVSPKAGTATSLKKIYDQPETSSPKVLSEMLQELTHRVSVDAKTWRASDHMGTISAALCWQKRVRTAAKSGGHSSRYQETTFRWEQELKDLRDNKLHIHGV